jgi:hypothetical protein
MALMTREQLRLFLATNGFPLGKSTLDKICSPAVNTGPPIEAWFGRRPLHSPEKGLAWARSRLTRSRGDLQSHTVVDPIVEQDAA